MRGGVLPQALAFHASLCIMTLELVAGRLLARHLGASLYTWTAVIGVILGGIALGNHVGGILADRPEPRRTAGVLFLVSGVASGLVLPLAFLVRDLPGVEIRTWPLRVLAVTALDFFAPAAVLGTLGPVVAKMAIDASRTTGRAVGNIYAWGALGSIAGTFLTGFVLIAWLGTQAIILLVALSLLASGLVLLGLRALGFGAGAAGAALLLAAAGPPWSWPGEPGQQLRLFRSAEAEPLLFEDESAYSYVAVREGGAEAPGARVLSLDHLVHGFYIPAEPERLVYPYEELTAAITRRAFAGRERPATFFVGGGCYTFPRWVEREYPDSRVVVAEIDPRVAEACHRALDLPRDDRIEHRFADARQVLFALPEDERFEAFYGDAFNHFAVPFHLVTREFNDELRRHLEPGGIYALNMIDVGRGRFVGAVVSTLRASFASVVGFVGGRPPLHDRWRYTYLLVASDRPLDELLSGLRPARPVSAFAFTPDDMEVAVARAGGLVLTDDYCPADTLILPAYGAPGGSMW